MERNISTQSQSFGTEDLNRCSIQTPYLEVRPSEAKNHKLLTECILREKFWIPLIRKILKRVWYPYSGVMLPVDPTSLFTSSKWGWGEENSTVRLLTLSRKRERASPGVMSWTEIVTAIDICETWVHGMMNHPCRTHSGSVMTGSKSGKDLF